jgi:hypothetical protein
LRKCVTTPQSASFPVGERCVSLNCATVLMYIRGCIAIFPVRPGVEAWKWCYTIQTVIICPPIIIISELYVIVWSSEPKTHWIWSRNVTHLHTHNCAQLYTVFCCSSMFHVQAPLYSFQWSCCYCVTYWPISVGITSKLTVPGMLFCH